MHISTKKELERLVVGISEECRLIDLEIQKDYISHSNLRNSLLRIRGFQAVISVLIAVLGLHDAKT